MTQDCAFILDHARPGHDKERMRELRYTFAELRAGAFRDVHAGTGQTPVPHARRRRAAAPTRHDGPGITAAERGRYRERTTWSGSTIARIFLETGQELAGTRHY